jgi:formate C-acetyltransferase
MLDTVKNSIVEQVMLDDVVTMETAPRVERLREAYLELQSSASILRARIETRTMKETAGEPMITRRAKAFDAVLRGMPANIYPDELIVGHMSVRPHCHDITPGVDDAAINERAARSQGYKARAHATGLSAEDVKELNEELAPYWKLQGRPSRIAHYGHNVHNFEKVLKKGFLGIKRDAEERLTRIDRTDPEDLKKIPFLEGVVLAMDAAADIGKAYAARARELAGTEKDAERRSELLEIAEVCDWVPANPARTLREAMQSYYFAWLTLLWEGWGSQGRADQYLYPYYEKDVREGRLTREQAQELIDCYIIKLNEGSQANTIGVSGLKADGSDATNELSYMFIEGMKHTRLINFFAVFIHTKTPNDLLTKSCELVSLGGGHPQFLNCDVGVAQALARGDMGGPAVTLEDARSAANVGCLELVIPGKDSGYLYTASHNLALAMELVMTGGLRRSDGKRIGAETGDPRQFKSFEDLQTAYHKQVAFMRENTQKGGIAYEQRLIDFYPTVYESALIEDCIEKGICREDGGAHYNFNTGGVEVGSSDAADSLAAIKKLVFDDETVTMAELCDALESNFEGREDIRKKCLEVPKFGNDDDYADEQKVWVVHQWVSEFTKLKNLRGGHGCPGGSSMAGYVPAGKEVGALPSGRLAQEPLAPAGSPCTGKDLNGPTAVIKSMGKLDNIEVLGGLSLTTRIDPSVFRVKDGIKRLADLLRAFVDQKVFHLQINVTSSAVLKAAQESPEEYRDLTVKVAGYNAFFTHLGKELQDSIIARTEHGL